MSKPTGTQDGNQRDLAAMLVLVEQLRPALQNDDRQGQVNAIRRLVDLRAPMGEQWRSLAGLAARNGELSLARQAIDLFVEVCGDTPLARYMKAALLEQCGLYREAHELVRTLPADVPDRASYAYSRGTVALYLGLMEEAREHLSTAVRLQPQMGQAWLSLMFASDLRSDKAFVHAVVSAERAMDRVPPAQRAPYLYALGQALAAEGDHAGAFRAFERGGQDVKSGTSYQPDADRRGMMESLHGFDAASIRSVARGQDRPTGRAMFVTGLPRAGTTLVQQALTRHGGVGGGAEMNLLMQLAREIGGHSSEAVVRRVETKGAADLARLWEHLLQERFPGSGRIVDKSLNTSRFMGLAAALLPDAPLVWITRDPLDQAWSCFRTYFRAGQEWSSDLGDIAHHFRLEDELLRRWQDILGERLLVVPYAALVEDFPGWMGRIAAHCGLTLETAMLSPHENEAVVPTASVAQVRRPVNREGLGVAEPYREFLEPFVSAYAA